MRASHQPDCARGVWLRRACVGCCVLMLSQFCLSAPLQSRPGLTSTDVEAAYLYDFGKFVQWPGDPAGDSQSFSICILGQDPFGKTLDKLVEDDTMQGRRIALRRLSTAAAADGCQILFIAPSEEARIDKDLAALGKKPILTVSDAPGFVDRGGVIQFILENNRVRFAVNLYAARQSGLALSSELLKVAAYVKSNSPQEALR